MPFEINLHTAPTREDVGGLRACTRDLKLTRGYVLHGGRTSYSLGDGIEALPAELLLRDYGRLRTL